MSGKFFSPYFDPCYYYYYDDDDDDGCHHLCSICTNRYIKMGLSTLQWVKKNFMVSENTGSNWGIQGLFMINNDFSTLFWVKLAKKITIVSLRWNLVTRIIWIYQILWWCSLFQFWTENILFGQIWSKKSKLSVYDETWHLN